MTAVFAPYAWPAGRLTTFPWAVAVNPAGLLGRAAPAGTAGKLAAARAQTL